jgi:hypothetical protein
VFADLPGVERAEQFVDALVYRRHVAGGDQPAGDAGLVGDDTDAKSRGAQPIERRARTGRRLHEIRIAVERNVKNEGAVPVEQDRIEQRRHHHGEQIPGWRRSKRQLSTLLHRHQPRHQWMIAMTGMTALESTIVEISRRVRGPGLILLTANSAVPASHAVAASPAATRHRRRRVPADMTTQPRVAAPAATTAACRRRRPDGTSRTCRQRGP